jgi:hypothetical protein
VCKSYSANGHCSFWGSESYQLRECVEWVKKPEYEKGSGSKLPPPKGSKKFIRMAGKSQFPKNTDRPSDGETFLRSQLTPFVCEIMKSDDIKKTLASIGQYNQIKNLSYPYGFITKDLTGGFSLPANDKSYGSLWVKRVNAKPWPFSEEELADWLSSLGLAVMRDSIADVVGVTGRPSARKNRYSRYGYEFSIGAAPQYNMYTNQYDKTAVYKSKVILVRWMAESKTKIKFCSD